MFKEYDKFDPLFNKGRDRFEIRTYIDNVSYGYTKDCGKSPMRLIQGQYIPLSFLPYKKSELLLYQERLMHTANNDDKEFTDNDCFCVYDYNRTDDELVIASLLIL
jgi:hypothetical protein